VLIAIAIATPTLAVAFGIAAVIWLLCKFGEFVDLKRTERAARCRSLKTAIYTLGDFLRRPLTEKGWEFMADNIFNRGTLPSWVERPQLATSADVRAVITLLKRSMGSRGRRLHRQGLYQSSLPLETVPLGA
jgi:hypothetical protein